MKKLQQWIDKVDKMYHRYRNILKIIDTKVNTTTVIKSVLFALLISLLIVLIPALVAINLFIYSKLSVILSIFLLILLTSWGFLYFHFYYSLLKTYIPDLENVNLKLPKLFEGSLVSFFLLVLGTIVISVIF
ncbi:MAG: hypothetical protein WCW63_00420 [Acholeplasmataceae bacterium]